MRISDWSSDVCSSDLLTGVVDGVGGAAHIGLPRVGAGFAAAAGFLLAAEGAADLGPARADIHVDDAAFAAYRRHEGDRKSVVKGKSGSVRVDLGGRRILKKTKIKEH